MKTPDCAATYEAGHSDCDGASRGRACRLRKRCIGLTRFAKAEKIEPQKLARSLSMKEINAFCAGRLELRVTTTRGGNSMLNKVLKHKTAPKPPPIFRTTHWKLYREFEKALVELFSTRRVVNRLMWKVKHAKKIRASGHGKKAVLRKGALYPIVKTRGDDIEQVNWCFTNAYQADACLAQINPLNKPTRLWIRMQFPIAELELRMAPELISELGLNLRSGRGARRVYFIVRTASTKLIKLSVYALKIMVDSGYLGVPEFGTAKLIAEGG